MALFLQHDTAMRKGYPGLTYNPMCSLPAATYPGQGLAQSQYFVNLIILTKQRSSFPTHAGKDDRRVD